MVAAKGKQMAVVVFDLDMTLIDSSHRHASNPDGSIDLAHWFQNATPEKIAKDTLLPLARLVPRYYAAGHKIVLCTARCLQTADHKFLADHAKELPHHALFGRPGYFVTPDMAEYPNSYHGFVGDTSGDGELKIRQIQEYIETLGFKNFMAARVQIFEDNLKSLALFRKYGAAGIDATKINEALKNA
jgi:hypothetical protein